MFFTTISQTIVSPTFAVGMGSVASVISVSTALIFPVALIAALWPLGLTGLWLNFAATSLLAGLLAGVIMIRFQKEMRGLKAG